MAPAAKPTEAPKATPAATKDAVQPATNPADAKAGTKPGTDKDAKKIDPKAVVPAAPTGATLPKADAGKGAAVKVDAPKTTEKPSDTKKQ
jgi:hypothetical protein